MKAFLVDPAARRIDEVEYSGNYEDIYELIDARLFELAQFDGETGDGAYVDEEGLYAEEKAWWTIQGFPQPLANKGLILGTDMNTGASRSPQITLEALFKRVQFGVLLNVNGSVRFVGETAWAIGQNSPRL